MGTFALENAFFTRTESQGQVVDPQEHPNSGALHGRESAASARDETSLYVPGDGKVRVQSVARAVQILQLVAVDCGKGVAARDLASAMRVPRQVVYHLVHTLVTTGMLRKVSGSRYVLGLGLGPMAQGFKRQLAAFDALGQYVTEASATTGETAYASAWVDGEIVVKATARGDLPVHAAEVPLGTGGSAHARASGKLLLAMLDDNEVEAYLLRHAMVPRTAHTIVSVRALLKELEKVRREQVAVDAEEYSEGLTCMAIPLGTGPSQAALGISVPTYRMKENQGRYLSILREIVARPRA